MTIYSAETLDLSRLPSFRLVDANFEQLLAAHKQAFVTRWQAERQRDPSLPDYDVEGLETDPIIIAMQENSYRRLLDLQALNDAGKRLTLAYSDGEALAHLAATYHRTQRMELKPATSNSPAVLESDDELRARAQLAPEATPRFGITRGGYIYTILSNFPSIKDVRPIRMGGGAVQLWVLGRDGDGTVETGTIAAIIRMLEPEDGSQSTDIVSVFAAEIDRVTVRLKLLIPRGPDSEAVIAAARPSVETYGRSIHRLNGRIYPDALQASAHVGPVTSVLIQDLDVPVQRPQAAPFLETLEIVTEVIGG